MRVCQPPDYKSSTQRASVFTVGNCYLIEMLISGINRVLRQRAGVELWARSTLPWASAATRLNTVRWRLIFGRPLLGQGAGFLLP